MSYKKLENLQGDIWEKQQGESSIHYKLFEIYRDSVPQISIKKVAEKCNKSASAIEKIAAQNQWTTRRDAWFDYQGKLTIEALKRGIPKMRKTHTDVATSILAKACQALKNINPDDFSPKDIFTAIETACKLERLSRGETTEKIETHSEISGKDGKPIEFQQVRVYLPEKEELE